MLPLEAPEIHIEKEESMILHSGTVTFLPKDFASQLGNGSNAEVGFTTPEFFQYPPGDESKIWIKKWLEGDLENSATWLAKFVSKLDLIWKILSMKKIAESSQLGMSTNKQKWQFVLVCSSWGYTNYEPAQMFQFYEPRCAS